jgi:hypothetical protein
MKSNWFVVIRVHQDWWIDNEGTPFGPFPSRDAACAASSRIARTFGDPRRHTLVYWPDDTGKPQLMFDGL